MINTELYTTQIIDDNERRRVESIIRTIKFKTYAYSKMAKKYKLKNGLLFGSATVVAILSTSLSFLSIFTVIATAISGLLVAASKFKNYETKYNRADIASQCYESILSNLTNLNFDNEIDRVKFISDFNLLDNFVIAHCPSIPNKYLKKFEKKNDIEVRENSNI